MESPEEGPPESGEDAPPGRAESSAGPGESAEPAEPAELGGPGELDIADDERETAYGLFKRGQDLMRRRHHAQAAIVLERAARIEPGKGSILEALGRAFYNSGQHERSRATFVELLEVDPSAHYAHYALGQSLKQLGRRREAWTHLRLAVALQPTSRLYRGALDRLGPVADEA
jgi:tetratricopeptide (TPR) repeat protein